MLNNATWKIRKLISISTFCVDDVDIASSACCICEVDILATASSLLRHDESRCSPVGLMRMGALIRVMARLPTVVTEEPPCCCGCCLGCCRCCGGCLFC